VGDRCEGICGRGDSKPHRLGSDGRRLVKGAWIEAQKRGCRGFVVPSPIFLWAFRGSLGRLVMVGVVAGWGKNEWIRKRLRGRKGRNTNGA